MKERPRAVTSDWFFWLIGPLVLFSRCLTVSYPFFADGPRLIRAIENHTYVIQPPGYWLYARVAGLFSNPAFGLSFLNVMASSVGAVVFYLICLRFADRTTARLATAAYATVYFSWYAGSTHSTYAGELLCAPLLFISMLRYIEHPVILNLGGIALSYALAAGVRPSDGVFLMPLLVFFILRYIPTWNERVVMLCAAAILCLIWYIPERIALNKANELLGKQFWSMARSEAPILHGFSKLAISNIVRVVFPCVVAFWSLAPLILTSGEKWIRRMLWIWIVPGLAFFLLVYMSDATFLCFITSAIILLAVTARASSWRYLGLSLCFVSNLLFFCLAKPVDTTQRLSVAVYSVSGARFCRWALKHEWYRTLDSYHAVPEIGPHPK